MERDNRSAMTSSCPHHPACPGCPLRDRPYAEQRATKRARLQHALSAFPHLELHAPDVIGALHPDGYRHRLKLPVHHGREGAVAIGLTERRSGRTLDTPDCVVLTPALRDGLGRVRAWLSGRREVHSVDLRVSDATGEAQLVLACDGGSLQGGRRAVSSLQEAWPALTSVAVSTADPARKRVMGRKPRLLAGADHLMEAIGATRYRLYPGAFFQVDPRNAVQVLDLVREGVGDARTLLDLYAGVGAWGLALAEGRDRVVLAEEVPQAAEAARAMAPPHVTVHTSRVEDLVLDDPFDAAILNPARRGSDPDLLARLARLTRRLVYVSCGPETLARDLDVLATHGMRVDALHAVDLFPQTPEVESVVWLSRGPALATWQGDGGTVGGPWKGHPSGAVGRSSEAVALVLGDPGPRGRTTVGDYERLAMVATHGLIRLRLRGPVGLALRDLARRGHPTAGRDERTARFFAEKAGLLRPFVHITRAGRTHAPLHGDLVLALQALRAPGELVDALACPRGER